MYQYLIPTRILFSIAIGLLIFSLVFGWVSFAVPDWLQFYERNHSSNQTNVDSDLKKFGLWYQCVFRTESNDFTCILWHNNTPSFVRVVQVLIPIGLAFSCLSFISACLAFICIRSFITTVLFASLFAFLSFFFSIIGTTVFANESLVYVERLNNERNVHPRRWGMWLLIPYLVLSFFTSIFFFISALLNWCDYRRSNISGILNHSVGKFNGSVDKLPSDGNTTTAVKKQFPYPDYPTTCYQLNGSNNQQQNPSGYPPPPSYGAQGYQQTPAGGLFGYSRPGTPTMNPMYPYSNFDSYHHRNYMTETSEMDEYPRSHRSHRRSRRRSRSYSSPSSITEVNTSKQPQFIPVPVPYYQPQGQTQTVSNTNSKPMSYVVPQQKQQFLDETNQTAPTFANLIPYNSGQQSVMVSNPSQPVYTIAYRPNNGGNIISGPATATYVTATNNGQFESSPFNSDSDDENRQYTKPEKIHINEAWAWRKMR